MVLGWGSRVVHVWAFLRRYRRGCDDFTCFQKILAAPDPGPAQPRKKSEWILIVYCFHCFASGVYSR